MTDRPKWLQTLKGLTGGERVRYDLMPIDEARAELAQLPVVLAAEVCCQSVGCGDEMALLPLLPPETAVAVLFTDPTLFAQADGLHLFRQMVVREQDEEAYDADLAERTVTVTTTSGKTVRVPIVIDPERAKTYVLTVINMDTKARKELYRHMDPSGEQELSAGEDCFRHLIAFVLCAMDDGDLEGDEEFQEAVRDFDEGLYFDVLGIVDRMERVALEQELFEPHREAMARYFAVVADLFEQHADKDVGELIEGIEGLED